MDNFKLFRNDFNPNSNVRSSCGMAMYIKSNKNFATTPFRSNFNNILCVLNDSVPTLHIVGTYRSKSKANQQKLIETINHLDTVIPSADTPTVILDDFNTMKMKLSISKQCRTNITYYLHLIYHYCIAYSRVATHQNKKIPDFSLTVKQFSVSLQDDYSGHESTKIRMALIIFKRKLPFLHENI